MQHISSSSQDQTQPRRLTLPTQETASAPVQPFTHTVSAAYGHATASTSTREQLTNEAGIPSGTGLAARTITVGTPLTDDQYLPEGHTYQPYFSISQLAHCQAYRLVAPSITVHTGDVQSQVIRQFLMSEREAKKDFQERFEYRFVDYGYTSVDAAGMPEKNYGVFARKSVAKGEFLGIYSCIGYLNISETWEETNHNWDTGFLHQKFFEEAPDFMSYHRTLMAGLRGKEQTQRTVVKYNIEARPEDSLNCICFAPDNERYTPMHFVNSANRSENVNAKFELISIKTDSGNFLSPILAATKNIAVGQELLASYYVDSNVKTSGVYERSATEEKEFYNVIMDDYLDFIDKLNNVEPDRQPISPYVAAPALSISQVFRIIAARRSVAKTDEPSSSGAARY